METMVEYKREKKLDINTGSIFIVDDDILYLSPLAEYVKRRFKNPVYSFTSGEECISKMELKPKIVILDYNLNPQWPDTMNGPDVLKQIKKISPETVVVMLSGRDLYTDVLRTLKLGAYTYVIKDIEANDSIYKIIEAFCGSNRIGSI